MAGAYFKFVGISGLRVGNWRALGVERAVLKFSANGLKKFWDIRSKIGIGGVIAWV